jgi:LysM repeat protein
MKGRMLTLGVIAVSLMLMVVSCSQSPEQNPIIQEKFQKIAELAEQLDQVKAGMKDTNNDLDTVKQDVVSLKQTPAGGAPSADVEELKAKVKTLEDEVVKLQSELSVAKKRPSATSEESPKKSSESTASKKSSEPKVSEEPAAVREKGVTYKVKEGDTIESIAKAHGTTAAAIRAKNPIPEGKEPRAGSMIFVPAK